MVVVGGGCCVERCWREEGLCAGKRVEGVACMGAGREKTLWCGRRGNGGAWSSLCEKGERPCNQDGDKVGSEAGGQAGDVDEARESPSTGLVVAPGAMLGNAVLGRRLGRRVVFFKKRETP